MPMYGHGSPESRAVVIPFPIGRTRDAEVRCIHRESIAGEKKSASVFLLIVLALTLSTIAAAYVGFEYVKRAM